MRWQHFITRGGLTAVAAAVLAPQAASAQNIGDSFLFGGFESGLSTWSIDATGEVGGALAFGVSTVGATEGSQSAAVETGPGFGRDIVFNADVFDPIFTTFSDAGAAPDQWSVDFDVTLTTDSWADLTSVGEFFSIGTVGNSDGGFFQTFNDAFAPVGQASVQNLSIPVTNLGYTENSGFYQFYIQSNGDQVNGPGGEGVTYYVDNVRLTFNGEPVEPPTFVEDQLFSWETPDDAGTPGVNEQLEGWTDGFGPPAHPSHVRSISTTDGVTDGSAALEFVTGGENNNPGEYFAWGSQFTLDAGEEGDPTLQADVTDFIDRFNAASKLAWDVTVPADQFPFSPGFAQNFINIADDSGAFYQVQAPNIDLGEEGIQTLEVDLADIVDVNGSNLSVADGLNPDSTFFRITLGTNSDDDFRFFVDNMRLLVEEGSNDLMADFNGDGTVDLLDLDILGANFGVHRGACRPATPTATARSTCWTSTSSAASSARRPLRPSPSRPPRSWPCRCSSRPACRVVAAEL